MLPIVALVAGVADDPTALVIAGLSAGVTTLLGVVLALVASRAKQVEESLKEQVRQINALYVTSATHAGLLTTHGAEIEAIKSKTLSVDIFDRATADQNRRLEELRAQSQVLDRKVDKVDRALVARALAPTRDDASDAPPAPRPRIP